MKVFENKFVIISFNKELSLMDFLWNKETKEAKEEDYKDWNTNLAQQVTKYKPKYVLSDNTNYFFPIIPELQEWSVENIFVPMTNAGVKKLAMIVSKEFIAQISLEQFSDEAEESNAGFVTKYFENKEEAMEWFS